jgi:hypothetical protein
MSPPIEVALFANLGFADAAILKGQFVLLKVLQDTVGVFALEQD